jgi:hypothetical protein
VPRQLIPLIPLLLCLGAVVPAQAEEGADATDTSAGSTESTSSDPEAPRAREGSGTNCLGEPRARPVMSHVIGIKYGALGLEHQMKIGGCTPLVRRPGRLFDLSFFEAGFQMHTSPIYVMPGGYVVVAPLSILQFHFQAAGILYWPIGLDGAGYYPLSSYASRYDQPFLPGEEGQAALGWYLRTGPVLQLAVPAGPVRLIVLGSAFFERWVIGTAEHYFHNRNDLPAANPEWMVDAAGLVLVEVRVHPNALLRVGINDQLTMNFGAKQKSNVLAGVAMIELDRVGRAVRKFTPILRLGGRTHHPERKGDFTFTIALAFQVDLLAKKKAAAQTQRSNPADALTALAALGSH